MKFYKYIDTLPENPSEGSFNSGDIIAVRKEVAGVYRWETYKVAADGGKYASSITVEEWQKLDSLSTSDISKLSGLNTQVQLDVKFQEQKNYTDAQVKQTVSETIDLKGATVLPRGSTIPSYITTVGKATLYGGTGGTTYTNTGLPAPNNVIVVQEGYVADAIYNKSADTWSLGSSAPLPKVTPINNLSSSSTIDSLSANMGKTLDDKKITKYSRGIYLEQSIKI